MKRAWLHALLLCVAVLIVFHQVVLFPFLTWDDTTNVTENPLVWGGTFAGLKQLWSEPYASLYVPVAYTWFWLLGRASRFTMPGGIGLDPHVFHGANLVLHALCALLVYRIVSKLVASPLAAFVGALVFALHPLVAESVAWVTEARGLVSTCFALVALDQWLTVGTRQKQGEPVRAGWRHALATACFVAAMLSKPQAVALPLVVLVIDRWIVGREWKRIVPGVAIGCVLALAVVLRTKSVQGDETLHYVAPLWSRPLVALDALGFYTWKTLVPAGLTTDYGRNPAWLLASIGRAWPALIPVALAVGLWFVKRARPGLVAYALFAAALLPVLGLVSFAYQDISTVADRYAYPALLALALAVALLLERVPAAFQWAVAVLVLAGFGTLSTTQAETWHSNEALFARVLEINPRSWKAEGNLGIAAARAKRFDEAIAHYERALEYGPPRWIVHQNLGLALRQQGRLAESAEHLEKSLELRPDNPGVSMILGSVLLQLGRYAQAEVPLRAALAVDPKRAEALEWLGTALLAQDKGVEALEVYRKALESRDTPELRMNMGQALMLTGDAPGAVAELRSVLKSKPGEPDAEIDLAWLLATAPDDAVRNPSEAMALVVRAQAKAKTPSARYLDTLAAAEAATGRFEEAAKTAERALKLVPLEQSAYAARIEKRRQAYASGKDWRDLVR